MATDPIVILSYARTPMGSMQGSLAALSASELGAAAVRPGDAVLVSGPIGEHGVTIMLARGELEIEADLAEARPLPGAALTVCLVTCGDTACIGVNVDASAVADREQLAESLAEEVAAFGG